MVRELHEKSEYMRTRLRQRGFGLGTSETHIMPIVIRDEPAWIRLHHLLYARGFYLVPFVYPGVRQGEERLRLNATRGHSYSEIDALVDTLAECRELDREASTCQASSS